MTAPRSLEEWCTSCHGWLDPDALEAGETTCTRCAREAHEEYEWECEDGR